MALVRDTLSRGLTPVVQAYALGKAQEVTSILAGAGIAVQQHPVIYEISQVYIACGVELGTVELYRGKPREGCVVIVPPQRHSGRSGEDQATGYVRRHRLGDAFDAAAGR